MAMLLRRRALVTKADGSQAWVNMPFPGSDARLRDYTAGGGGGAIYRYKRVPNNPLPSTYGYNQVCPQKSNHIHLQMLISKKVRPSMSRCAECITSMSPTAAFEWHYTAQRPTAPM
jgi:hypothetical protein